MPAAVARRTALLFPHGSRPGKAHWGKAGRDQAAPAGAEARPLAPRLDIIGFATPRFRRPGPSPSRQLRRKGSGQSPPPFSPPSPPPDAHIRHPLRSGVLRFLVVGCRYSVRSVARLSFSRFPSHIGSPHLRVNAYPYTSIKRPPSSGRKVLHPTNCDARLV